MRTEFMKRRLFWLVLLNLGLAGLGVAARSAQAEQTPDLRDCCKADTEGGQHCCVDCCFGFYDSCVTSSQCNL
jgi:hypothetical protein